MFTEINWIIKKEIFAKQILLFEKKLLKTIVRPSKLKKIKQLLLSSREKNAQRNISIIRVRYRENQQLEKIEISLSTFSYVHH